MVVQMIPEREFRGPGCGETCRVVKAMIAGVFGRSELLLHDPAAHEEYGRQQVVVSVPIRILETVRTGPLTIDLLHHVVRVGDEDLALGSSQYRTLEVLAEVPGRLFTTEELAARGWGLNRVTPRDAHLARATIYRLRERLGPVGYLIETLTGGGYRLRMEAPRPYEGPSLARSSTGGGSHLTPGQWATHWDRCRSCGETRRRHHGLGLCRRCWMLQHKRKMRRRRAGQRAAGGTS